MVEELGGMTDLKYIADENIPVKRVPTVKPLNKRTKHFVKGPINIEWISKVTLLPGKALNVGIALMYLKGLTKSDENLMLTDKIFKTFNVSRKSVYKVLALMEKAGLIQVERTQGRKNRIKIIDSSSDEQIWQKGDR